MASEGKAPVSKIDPDGHSPVEGYPRLVWKPDVTCWYPCVRGTDVSTYLVGRLHSTGVLWENIRRTYGLSDDDIRACLEYARTEKLPSAIVPQNPMEDLHG